MRGDYIAAIDKDILARLKAPSDRLGGFSGMMRYQLELAGPLDAPPADLARRWHGQMCLAVCRALGGAWQEALPAAASVELMAGSFRIHDDIERGNPTVWGRPATWKLWGMPQAINTGDGMYPLAAQAMLDVSKSPETSLLLCRGLADVWLSLTHAQDRFLSAENRHDAAPAEHIRALELTLGAIGGFSAWAGATIAGAAEDVCRRLRTFGSCLGVLRQMRDNIVAAVLPDESSIPQAENDALEARQAWPTLHELDRQLDRALRVLGEARLGKSAEHQLEVFARELRWP